MIRNLEVIGEAAKRVSPVLRVTLPEPDWRRIYGMRDVLIHGCIVVDIERSSERRGQALARDSAGVAELLDIGRLAPRAGTKPPPARAIFKYNQCISVFLLRCIGIT